MVAPSQDPLKPPEAAAQSAESSAVEPNPYEVSAQYEPGTAPTFRLSTLLLTITLIAICLGVGTWLPGVGIGLAVLIAPAYVRTALAGLRLRREGKAATIEEKFIVFFASLAIVTAIAVASGVAFYATCWVGFFGGSLASEAAGVKGYDSLFHGLAAGVVTGGIAGIVALFFAARWLWPYRKFN
jgi:hypothetical protein